jgi:hypothetical protein
MSVTEEENAGWLRDAASSVPVRVGELPAGERSLVTGVARDPYDGAPQGFRINDSGTGQSRQFVSAHLMITAFERPGGFCVVTEGSWADPPEPASNGNGDDTEGRDGGSRAR